MSKPTIDVKMITFFQGKLILQQCECASEYYYKGVKIHRDGINNNYQWACTHNQMMSVDGFIVDGVQTDHFIFYLGLKHRVSVKCDEYKASIAGYCKTFDEWDLFSKADEILDEFTDIEMRQLFAGLKFIRSFIELRKITAEVKARRRALITAESNPLDLIDDQYEDKEEEKK